MDGSRFVHTVCVEISNCFYFVCRIICLLNVHSHHGDHHHETNMTVKAAILHTVGDVLHSLAVLVGAILIKINVSQIDRNLFNLLLKSKDLDEFA